MQHLESIGQRIRAARAQRGWSQARLHIVSGVNLSDISRVERGRLVPTPTQLGRLAEALELTAISEECCAQRG